MTRKNYYDEVKDKLKEVYRKEHIGKALLGLLLSLMFLVTTILFFTIIEAIFHCSSYARTIFVVLTTISFLIPFTTIFLWNIAKAFSNYFEINFPQLALTTGNYFPDIKDELSDALQIYSFQSESKYSGQLIDAAFSNVYAKTINKNLHSFLNFEIHKKLLHIFIVSLAFTIILIFAVPGLNQAFGRILNYNQEFLPPQKFYFEVSPGNYKVTKGNDLEIKIKIKGTPPEEVYLQLKEDDQPDFKKIKIEPDSMGVFVYSMTSVQRSFVYYAEAENIKSDEYSIKVINYPEIKLLSFNVAPPSYTGIKSSDQGDNGNVTGLPGTAVRINLTSTKKLKAGAIVFGDTTEVKLKIENEKASGVFYLKKDDSYRIKIIDEDNNQNQFPITYTIKTLTDEYPSIQLIQPVQNIDLGKDNRVNIAASIFDDYGFSKLIIKYKIDNKEKQEVNNNFKEINVPIDKGNKEQAINYIWNLSPLKIGGSDIITFYLEVYDNDYVSGPKFAKTISLIIKVPTLEELLTKSDQTQKSVNQDLKELQKESEDLKKNLEKVDQELKQDKKDITWQEKEKIQNTIDKYNKMQDKTQQASNQLKQMQDDLQKNNLLSKETLEKYNELQELFSQLTGEEMKKAMEKLQSVLQSMDRQSIQDAMKNFKVDEELFKKSLERTISLLKKVQLEQKMDEVVKRTEEISKEQNEIGNKTKELNQNDKNQKEELKDRQNNLTKDLKNLEQELKDLQDKMSKIDDTPMDKMEDALKEFTQQKNDKLSEQAKSNIEQNNKQSAQQNQNQISSNMDKFKKDMQQMQSQMNQQNSAQAFKDMMKSLDNLISLSKMQENLKKETLNQNSSSPSLNNTAEGQEQLKSSLDKIMQQLAELSQKTFAVSPEMGKALGDAKKKMNESSQDIQGRNPGQAANDQGEAMESLNKAAVLMKNAMQSMMQPGGNGSGMMSLMQQLAQMTGQQMQLNNMTQQLQQQGGSLTPQQQSQLQRIAQQQELIKKSIEQLNKEAEFQGESKKLPGLNEVPKQMQEIINEMNSQKLNDEIVQKQERILSRMLDAQKSNNQRDYEKERESFTGKNIAGKNPNQLKLNPVERQNKLRDELNKAAQEGYNKDYENLIRRYFEALQQKQ